MSSREKLFRSILRTVAGCGQRTRARILTRAVDIASPEGLGSLSLAQLGSELAISKSGVSGHIASGVELQPAVLEVAVRLYTERVAVPALRAPRGSPQLWHCARAGSRSWSPAS